MGETRDKRSSVDRLGAVDEDACGHWDERVETTPRVGFLLPGGEKPTSDPRTRTRLDYLPRRPRDVI